MWHQHFSPKIHSGCYIKRYGYILHFNTLFLILLTFFEFSKVVLTNIVIILMVSAKLSTLGLLKMKVLWNKVYDVITPIHDITNKLLSRDSNCIVDMWSCDQGLVTLVFLWQKLSSPQICKDLTRKIIFLEGCSWFKVINLGLSLGMALKFCTSVAKGSKLKVRKFWGQIPMFVEVTREKLLGGPFCPPPPPSWKGLKRVYNAVLSLKKYVLALLSRMHIYKFMCVHDKFF